MSEHAAPAPVPTAEGSADLIAAVHALVDTVEALASQVDALEGEVGALRSELAQTRAAIPVPEETVLAISAAVAAYLGHEAKLKQIHYRTGAAWAQQGRVAVQGRSVMHGVR